MRRVLKPLLLVLAVVVALWVMSSRAEPTPDPAPAPPATASASPEAARHSASTTAPARSPSPQAGPSTPVGGDELPASSTVDAGEVEGDVVDPTAPAIARDEAQRARFARYEQAATDFLTVFARPGAEVSSQQWWATVRPRLAEVAVAAYEGTDPANVPFTAVTGPAVIMPTDAPSDLLMLARVPTDAGYYRVEMMTGPSGIRISLVTPEGGGQ